MTDQAHPHLGTDVGTDKEVRPMQLRGLGIVLAVLALIVLVVPLLGGSVVGAGTTGPGWCGYWPGT